MSPDVVADTQAIVWLYFEPPRLSARARTALEAATQHGRLYISAITLIELVYLEEKLKITPVGVRSRLTALAADPNHPLTVLPITPDVATALVQVSRTEIPDMPDRIIAATAVAHNLPLVSADTRIRKSASLIALVSVIW
jgi:PIN domain nuclease of toxin-antitoxin system